MTRLTIALPVAAADSVAAFEETLASVLEYQTASCDIIVMHAAAYDDPWNTREDGVQFETCSRSASLTEMLNTSLTISRGDVMLVLRPGTELSRETVDAAIDSFATRLTLGWLAPTLVTAEQPQRTLSSGFTFQPQSGTFKPSRQEDDSAIQVPHVAAAYFRRQALLDAGGFDASLSLQMSYVDSVVRMDKLGWYGVAEPMVPVVALRRSCLKSTDGAFQRGRDLERLFRRWHSADSSTLAHWLRTHSEFWSAFPLPRAFLTLLGRCAATLIREPSDRRPQLAKFTARDNTESTQSIPIVVRKHSA